MKRNICRLLVLFLLMAAVSFTALASEYTVTLGREESIPFNMMAQSDCSYSLDGSLPGMSLVQFRGALVLEGIPELAGTFTLVLTETAADGSSRTETLVIRVVDPSGDDKPPEDDSSWEDISGPGSPEVTKNPTDEKVIEGQGAQFVARASNTRQYAWELLTVDGGTILCQDLTGIFTGMGVSGSNTERLSLTNIPLTLDGCRVRCRFVGAEESVFSDYALIQVVAASDAYPRVTKDPTDETVREGTMAQFVARADFVTEYLWMLSSPDGAQSYPCTGTIDRFPELKISGGNTECLTMNAIPYTLDGWRVFCVFSGPMGSVTSGKAIITVNPLPTEPTESETEPAQETTLPPEPSTEPPTQPSTQPQTEPPAETVSTHPDKAELLEESGFSKAPGSGQSSLVTVVIIAAAAIVAVAAIIGIVVLKLANRPRGKYAKDAEWE